MDTCQEFAALLDLYVDGELPPAEAERVQAHLETCGVAGPMWMTSRPSGPPSQRLKIPRYRKGLPMV